MPLIEWDALIASAILTKNFDRRELDLMVASLVELLDYMESKNVPEMEPRIFYLHHLLDNITAEDLHATIVQHEQDGMPLPPALMLLTLQGMDESGGPPAVDPSMN